MAETRRDYIWSFGARGAEGLGNVILSAVLARYLLPEGFGEFQYLFSIAMLVAFLSEFGGSQYLIAECADTDADQALARIHSLLPNYLFTSSILGCVLLLFVVLIFSLGGRSTETVVVLGLLGISEIIRKFAQYTQSAFRSLNDWRMNAIIEFLNYPLMTVVLIVNIYYVHGSLTSVSVGLLVARLALAGATGFFSWKRDLFGQVPNVRKLISFPHSHAFAYGIQGLLSYYGMSAFLPIVMFEMAGSSETGVFVAAQKVVMGGGLVIMPVIDVYFNRASTRSRMNNLTKRDLAVQSSGRVSLVLLISCFVAAAIGILSPLIVFFFFGPSYSRVAPLVSIAAFIIVCRACYSVAVQEVLVLRLYRRVLVIGALFTFVTAVSLITMLWIRAEAIMGIAAQYVGLVSSVGIALWTMRNRGIPFPVDRQMGLVLLLALSCCILGTMHAAGMEMALMIVGSTTVLVMWLNWRKIDRVKQNG